MPPNKDITNKTRTTRGVINSLFFASIENTTVSGSEMKTTIQKMSAYLLRLVNAQRKNALKRPFRLITFSSVDSDLAKISWSRYKEVKSLKGDLYGKKRQGAVSLRLSDLGPVVA